MDVGYPILIFLYVQNRVSVTKLQSVLDQSYQLAGGGSVAVAAGVYERWQVTCNMWQATVTHGMWHFFNLLVLVLLSANVKKFSVSWMQDLKVGWYWANVLGWPAVHNVLGQGCWCCCKGRYHSTGKGRPLQGKILSFWYPSHICIIFF